MAQNKGPPPETTTLCQFVGKQLEERAEAILAGKIPFVIAFFLQERIDYSIGQIS